jgi:hypothetical protein
MLSGGQKRSKGTTALAAEPGCATDFKRALNEFQVHTTTPKGSPKGWPLLSGDGVITGIEHQSLDAGDGRLN